MFAPPSPLSYVEFFTVALADSILSTVIRALGYLDWIYKDSEGANGFFFSLSFFFFVRVFYWIVASRLICLLFSFLSFLSLISARLILDGFPSSSLFARVKMCLQRNICDHWNFCSLFHKYLRTIFYRSKQSRERNISKQPLKFNEFNEFFSISSNAKYFRRIVRSFFFFFFFFFS